MTEEIWDVYVELAKAHEEIRRLRFALSKVDDGRHPLIIDCEPSDDPVRVLVSRYERLEKKLDAVKKDFDEVWVKHFGGGDRK